MYLSRLPLVAGATLVAVALSPAAPASAQPPHGYSTYRYGYNPGYYGSAKPVAPPNPKGGGNYAPLYHVSSAPTVKERPTAANASPSRALNVATRWTAPTIVYVGIRGLDGKVRYFALKNGPETIQVRRVTLRPGERLVLNVATPGPRKSAP